MAILSSVVTCSRRVEPFGDVLEVVKQVVQRYPTASKWGLTYDVGCELESSLAVKSLTRNSWLQSISLRSTPTNFPVNLGDIDGEGIERYWSRAAFLVRQLQTSSAIHRLQSLDAHIEYTSSCITRQFGATLCDRLWRVGKTLQAATLDLQNLNINKDDIVAQIDSQKTCVINRRKQTLPPRLRQIREVADNIEKLIIERNYELEQVHTRLRGHKTSQASYQLLYKKTNASKHCRFWTELGRLRRLQALRHLDHDSSQTFFLAMIDSCTDFLLGRAIANVVQITDLWKQQIDLGINPHPKPRSANVQAMLNGTAPPARYSIFDGYNTEGMLKISRATLSHQGSYGDRIQGLLDFLLGNYMLLRGNNRRNIEMADLYLLPHETEGPTQCNVLVILLSNRKTNQHGRVDHAGAMRNQDVLVCPFFMLLLHFFYRFHLDKEPFPVLRSNQQWFDTKLFFQYSPRKRATDRTTGIEYRSTQMKWTNRMFKEAAAFVDELSLHKCYKLVLGSELAVDKLARIAPFLYCNGSWYLQLLLSSSTFCNTYGESPLYRS
ncbi:hypothetical protein V1525DRAFT_391927, partial [Lipomyces kononenkoae]